MMIFWWKITLFTVLIVNELLPSAAHNELPRSKRAQRSVPFKPLLIPKKGYHRPSKLIDNMQVRKSANVYIVTLKSGTPTNVEVLPLSQLYEGDNTELNEANTDSKVIHLDSVDSELPLKYDNIILGDGNAKLKAKNSFEDYNVELPQAKNLEVLVKQIMNGINSKLPRPSDNSYLTEVLAQKSFNLNEAPKMFNVLPIEVVRDDESVTSLTSDENENELPVSKNVYVLLNKISKNNPKSELRERRYKKQMASKPILMIPQMKTEYEFSDLVL